MTVGAETRDVQTKRRRWLAVSWVVLISFVTAGVIVGDRWTRSVRDQQRHAIDAEATGVASTVATDLQRLSDLTVAGWAYMRVNPHPDSDQFQSWFDELDAVHRFPESLGFGFIVPVTPAQLPHYVSTLAADPSIDVPAGGFTVVPPGNRPLYCFGRLRAVMSHGLEDFPLGTDLCTLTNAFVRSRDTGAPAAVTIPGPNSSTALLTVKPLYSTEHMPATTAARRAELVGWVTGAFDLGAILDQAVRGRGGFAVTVSRSDLSTAEAADEAQLASTFASVTPHATLAHGSALDTFGDTRGAGRFHTLFTVHADGSWVVDVSGRPQLGGLSPTAQGTLVIVVAVLAGLLLFAFLQVLARSRGRALRMVEEKTDELRYRALHDALTGLPNRVLILDRAEQLIARSRRERSPVTAMFIDLDGFKGINDTFGHRAGDQVLTAVAERLEEAVRDSDTVGRLSGDEFVVLVDGLPGTADGVAERILDMLRSPFEIDTDEGTTIVALSASIGIARNRHEQSAGDLLRDADTALYAAKNDGRNRSVHFRPEMHTLVSDRFALASDLRSALDRGELFLAYQPTVELKDGAVTGVEALLRWNHPTRGVVPPADFIPIAEESGLIVDLGRWVLMQACDQAVRWNRSGHHIDMSVNLSARQLDCASLVDDVRTALDLTGMDPERLILEITETNLMRDAVATAERLTLLKSLGVRIAIDDFGTGYSSLAYLQQFPIDALKIDRSFVANIARTKEASVLIHTLVQLGKTLGLTTLAEGIEDETQLSYLQGEDCDNGQGFLFARPMEPRSVEALLNAARASAGVPVPRDGQEVSVPTS